MQTRALRTLVEIGRVGSFATAAGHLHMTLSAVSMQMKALEADLGVPLFDRSFRPPRLTPLGRSVCERAQALLRAESEIREACQPSDSLSGRYRIGFVPTASVRLLPTFLLNARTLSPPVSFDVVTGLSAALEEQVRDGDIDFAVVTASSELERGLVYHEIRNEVLAFATPRTSRSRSPVTLIRRIPFLQFSPLSGIGKQIARHMEETVGTGHEHLVLDSVEAIMECVNCGVGFTLLPEPDIRRYAEPGVRTVLTGEPALSRRLAMVSMLSRRHQAQLVANLIGDDQ